MADIHGDSWRNVLTGTAAADRIWGEGHDDKLYGAGGNDVLDGGWGNDTLSGEDGNDTLEGVSGEDVLNGGDGDDEITIGAGIDIVDGGAGIDGLGVDRGGTTIGVTFTLNGAVGSDGCHVINMEMMWYTAGSGQDNIGAAGGTIRAFGEGGDDTLTGFAGTDALDGGTGNDTLSGGAGTDSIDGGDGNDTLNGGDGDDRIATGIGVDAVDGGAGYDELFVSCWDLTGANSFSVDGTIGTDGSRAINIEELTYDGGPGADSVIGAVGDDRLYGYHGNDTLRGGSGNDRLVGYVGNDLLSGGAGADRLEGEDGIDTVSYYSSWVGVAINLGTGSASGGEAQGDTLSGIENVNGSQGSDHLIGTADANVMHGWVGNDVLIGGRGADRLTGGAGANRFLYIDPVQSPTGAGADRIADFSRAQGDRIELWAIDADTTAAGDQAFTFIGSGLYTGIAGQLRYSQGVDVVTIAGDVDGDGASDFHIQLTGIIALVAADLAL
ncbi:MAG: calcium-binding protein [Inquilinus sp.]|uniref:calcium-binding protein n=1 Tax=Inquilinus sp. TaxID=1932117 RepID=UPI003F377559